MTITIPDKVVEQVAAAIRDTTSDAMIAYLADKSDDEVVDMALTYVDWAHSLVIHFPRSVHAVT